MINKDYILQKCSESNSIIKQLKLYTNRSDSKATRKDFNQLFEELSNRIEDLESYILNQ